MRYLVLIIFVFVSIFCHPAIAEDIDYTALYGKGLYSAPMTIRVQFQTETGKAWPDVSEIERLNFIKKWNNARRLAIRSKKDILIKIKKTNKRYIEATKSRLKAASEREKKEAAKLKQNADEKRMRDQKVAQMKRKREEIQNRLRQFQQSRNHKKN